MGEELKELKDEMTTVTKTMTEMRISLGVLEATTKKLEETFGKGLDAISQAIVQLATVTTKLQENGEQHVLIHGRIDTCFADVASFRKEIGEDRQEQVRISKDVEALTTAHKACQEAKKDEQAQSIWPGIKQGMVWVLIGMAIILILSHAPEILSKIQIGGR